MHYKDEKYRIADKIYTVDCPLCSTYHELRLKRLWREL